MDRQRDDANPHGWSFPLRPDDMVYTTNRIVDGIATISDVYHDLDGDWQFVDDAGPLEVDDIAKVHVIHILEDHPEVAALHDLPCGWRAWREKPGGEWFREEFSAGNGDAVP